MSQNHTRKGRRRNPQNKGHAPRARQKEQQHAVPKRQAGLWLYGTHPVHAALGNQTRQIHQIIGTPDALSGLSAEALKQFKGATETVDRSDIDSLLGEDKVHQGIAIRVAPLPDLDVTDVVGPPDENTPALLVALDHVTDPHNVGAVLRSAVAFGARALLTTRHNAPEESGVLAKAASGALDVIPIIRTTNLKRAFKTCQDHGFWSVGLDASTDTDIGHMDLPRRCILVLGAEGKGMRQGTREVCDFMARLPMTGAIESLNVSNAAAVSLYEWQRQHGG